MDGLQLEALRILYGLERLNLTSVQTKYVKCIANRNLCRVQAIGLGIRGERRGSRANCIALAGTPVRALHQREERALLRTHLLLRYAQRHLRCTQRWASSEGIFNDLVQPVRLRRLPPLVGHPHARNEALCLIPLRGGRKRLLRQRLRHIAGHLGHVRRLKIGSDRTSGDQQVGHRQGGQM